MEEVFASDAACFLRHEAAQARRVAEPPKGVLTDEDVSMDEKKKKSNQKPADPAFGVHLQTFGQKVADDEVLRLVAHLPDLQCCMEPGSFAELRSFVRARVALASGSEPREAVFG